MACLDTILFYGALLALVLILFKLYLKFTTGWCFSQRCLVGKTAIVTGASSGIGLEIATDLAKRGAKVILACRNEQLANEAKDKIIIETDNPNVDFKLIDFSSLDSVRKFADEINHKESRLNILVNNAGKLNLSDKVTDDGLLTGMQVNYYGPVLLTLSLLDLLIKTKSSRIVNVSSNFAERGSLDLDTMNEFDSNFDVYPRSKLCIILFTIELAKRLIETTTTVYSVHPGMASTNLNKNIFPEPFATIFTSILKYFGKNITEAAQTGIYCAVAKGIENNSGEHFCDCKRLKKFGNTEDPTLPYRLWRKTAQDLKLSVME